MMCLFQFGQTETEEKISHLSWTEPRLSNRNASLSKLSWVHQSLSWDQATAILSLLSLVAGLDW